MKTLLPIFILLLSFYQTSFAQIRDSTINIDFEQPSDLIVLDTAKADTLWQIGTPSKTIFNAAHSGSKAIMTDTLNDYPAGARSHFILRIPPAWWEETSLSFWQRFDTGNGKDSGNMEVSYDKGASWDPMINSNNWSGYPAAETDWEYTDSSGTRYTSNLKITGDSKGWIHSIYTWIWLIPSKANNANSDSTSRPISNAVNNFYPGEDTVLVRFSFYSDTVQHSHEGWMIDDITITYSSPFGGSIHYHQADNNEMKITPNPVQDFATISLQKSLKVRQYIIYDQLGEIVRKNPIENTSFQINTSRLPKGVYYLSVIYDNNKSLIREFVKK